MTSQLTKTLSRTLNDYSVPKYDLLPIKQVHLGLGQFFRGHMASYTEKVCHKTPWGIAAVSMRTNDSVLAMNKQENCYSIIARDHISTEIEHIHCVQKCFFYHDDFDQVISLMSDENTQIISLTVTEKGYCYDFQSDSLDTDNTEIQNDLKGNSPKTSIGLIALAVEKRFETHKKPFTLLSCDNVSHNGQILQKAITRFLELKNSQALEWFKQSISCPCTMVDRIVPKTSEEEKREVQAQLPYYDEIPIITESFTQWCIEDHFSSDRPQWELAEAEFVGDITESEFLKLKVLNASHSYLTYLGIMKSHETVDQAINDEEILQDLEAMLQNEVYPTLKTSKQKFTDYKKTILDRFKNPYLRHQLRQIAMDGSQKIPQRWLPILKENQNCNILFKAIAVWSCFLEQEVQAGREIHDPLFKNLNSDHVILDFLKSNMPSLDFIIQDSRFREHYSEQRRRFLSKS